LQIIYLIKSKSRADTLANNFPLKVPEEYEDFVLSKDMFAQMNANFFFDFSIIKELNENLRKLVTPGRVVILDEKMKETSENWPYVSKAKGKWGIWNSEVAVRGCKTGLPFVFKILPRTCVKPTDVTNEPYNKKTVGQLCELIMKEGNFNEEVILISDAYYCSNEARRKLRNGNYLYLQAANSRWYFELVQKAKKYVKKVGDFVVLYSKELDEYFMFMNSAEFGEKGVFNKCI
jgi:hypothetical protein